MGGETSRRRWLTVSSQLNVRSLSSSMFKHAAFFVCDHVVSLSSPISSWNRLQAGGANSPGRRIHGAFESFNILSEIKHRFGTHVCTQHD